jgi:hypothetical protein
MEEAREDLEALHEDGGPPFADVADSRRHGRDGCRDW